MVSATVSGMISDRENLLLMGSTLVGSDATTSSCSLLTNKLTKFGPVGVFVLNLIPGG